jgi:transcription elongation GreA/GreB family factor
VGDLKENAEYHDAKDAGRRRVELEHARSSVDVAVHGAR